MSEMENVAPQTVGRAAGAVGEAAASGAGWCWGTSSDVAPQTVGRAAGAVGIFPTESAGWCWDWVPLD